MLGFNISILDLNTRRGLRSMLMGPTSDERAAAEAERRSQPMPGWFSELNEHDDTEVMRLAFTDELDEVVAARTGVGRRVEHVAGGDGTRTRNFKNRNDGRGRCPRTR